MRTQRELKLESHYALFSLCSFYFYKETRVSAFSFFIFFVK
ncbi:hypothetical protein I33_2957 [Bacillus subtilis subsp. subtilis str. RO-NN-1]|nr:hypothetical protein I33_2957 [Bacillus subtilis subsp. subtilis str. RO-NN-1]EME05974.1 hypothetical protein BS732_3461 [Bacillus subtilis MB73/2]